MNHIDVLNLMLSHERARLADSKTESEKELRKVWVKQLEKEIEGEQRFLSNEILSDALSDDELLSALGA